MRAGGGAESHQNTVKNQKKNFAFLKVHNELGKVTKFGTSRPLFSWRNERLKKVRADSAPPRPNRVNAAKADLVQNTISMDTTREKSKLKNCHWLKLDHVTSTTLDLIDSE